MSAQREHDKNVSVFVRVMYIRSAIELEDRELCDEIPIDTVYDNTRIHKSKMAIQKKKI